MFGPAQAAVARAVVDSVREGVIPEDQVEDLCIIVGVFIHWEAADDKKIFDYNYQATKESIARALGERAQPCRTILDGEAEARHPFAGGTDEGSHAGPDAAAVRAPPRRGPHGRHGREQRHRRRDRRGVRRRRRDRARDVPPQ